MPSVPKTPAFPLYGKDAYDDEAFSRLSFGAQGFYWFLAWWQWSEGSIPADLEAILDKVTRRKIAEARRLWAEVSPFFPITEDQTRRANATVERHRSKVCSDREKRQKGAAITNAKRWSESLPPSLSESLSDGLSESLRAATATASASATGSLSQTTKNPEGVQGEVRTPDFGAAARVAEKIHQSALRDMPPDQLVVVWLNSFGEELIVETLVDCEAEYTGKGWQYFKRILESRKADPSQRPGRRVLPKAARGNGRSDDASRQARDFGHRDSAEVLAELKLKGMLHPDID